MKTMTCRQLGGACDFQLHANTFEEMAELSKQHGMEMLQKGDKPHMEAMKKMQELMTSPKNMKTWFENRKREFAQLPETNEE